MMGTLLELLVQEKELVRNQEIGLVHQNIAIVSAVSISFLIPTYHIKDLKKFWYYYFGICVTVIPKFPFLFLLKAMKSHSGVFVPFVAQHLHLVVRLAGVMGTFHSLAP